MRLLKEKGLSQESFARLAGVSLNPAQRWVSGRQIPSLPPWRFLGLCQALDVDPQILAEAMREACEHPPEKQEDKGDRP